ncbi:MAG: SCP2 sterol-binding domain-containing protein [Anaerolineae bacterium]
MATAKEIIEQLPAAFKSEKAGDIDVTIQVELTGDGGGAWALKIANGACEVVDGGADSPDMSLTMEASDFVAMRNGELNPMAAFMQGKIKIQGDMGLAMKFQELFM